MKKPLLMILVLMSTILTACMKGPTENGILIALKDNKPCFYVYGEEHKDTDAAEYLLHLANLNSSVDNEKEGQSIFFRGELPILKGADSCFVFPQEFEYRLNDIYVIESSSHYTSSDFCLVENNGTLQINQAEYVRDSQGWSTQVCSDKAYSNHRGIWWRFKRRLF